MKNVLEAVLQPHIAERLRIAGEHWPEGYCPSIGEFETLTHIDVPQVPMEQTELDCIEVIWFAITSAGKPSKAARSTFFSIRQHPRGETGWFGDRSKWTRAEAIQMAIAQGPTHKPARDCVWSPPILKWDNWPNLT